MSLRFHVDLNVAVLNLSLPSKAEIDALLLFSQPIGAAYAGVWSSRDTLVITVSNRTGFQAQIGVLRATVRVEADVQFFIGSPASNATSAVIQGSWSTGEREKREQGSSGVAWRWGGGEEWRWRDGSVCAWLFKCVCLYVCKPHHLKKKTTICH